MRPSKLVRSLLVLLTVLLLSIRELAAQMTPGPVGSPTTVNVTQVQSFTATLPPTSVNDWYNQFYVRIAGSNAYQWDHTCNTIADPTSNLFFMEADGNYNDWTVPWVPGNGKFGGNEGTWENSQCELQVVKSRVWINPDRSATITFTVKFKNPTPLVPHNSTPCGQPGNNCDLYAPGGDIVGTGNYSSERYWWTMGHTAAGNWVGWNVMGPVNRFAYIAEDPWITPNRQATPGTQAFLVKVPGRYWPPNPNTVQWERVEFRITKPRDPGPPQGALPSPVRADTACTVIAWPGSNQFNLENDAGNGYVGANVTGGSGSTLSNSQCILEMSGSSVAHSGRDAIMNARIQFRSAFAPGNAERTMWVRAVGPHGSIDWGSHGWIKPDAAPTIFDPTEVVGSTAAIISWATSEPSDSQVFIAGTPVSPLDPAPKLYHSVAIGALAPGTTYQYEVRSGDGMNVSTAAGSLRTADAVPAVTSVRRVNRDSSIHGPGFRWEPTAARGSQSWVNGWFDFVTLKSYVSYGVFTHGVGSNSDVGSWSDPIEISAGGFGLFDLNVAWDHFRSRFVYVGIDNGYNVRYGYSTDSVGQTWTSPATIIQATTNPVQNWDYPSIAIDGIGRILIGAHRLNGPPGTPSTIVVGYSAAMFNSSTLPAGPLTPAPIVAGDRQGAFSRVVATNAKFHAFVSTVEPSGQNEGLPKAVHRYESTDGVAWLVPPLPLTGTAPSPPRRQSDTDPPVFFASQFLAASGAVDPNGTGSDPGYWAVAFQELWGSRNAAIVCASNRGCGRIWPADNDQFLVGVSANSDGSLWHSYFTYGNPPSQLQPLEIHAWYLPPGVNGIAARVAQDIDPAAWFLHATRCRTLTDPPQDRVCNAMGDFNTIASFAPRVSIPFIKEFTIPFNDLYQMFLQPPGFTGNGSAGPQRPQQPIAWMPFGAIHARFGVRHAQTGLPPGIRAIRNTLGRRP